MARVAVMGRIPRPGHVKRRLARSVGDAAAASLYEAFVRDEIDTLTRGGFLPLYAHGPLDEPGDIALLERAAGEAPRLELPGHDLASDLLAAFNILCADGPAAIVSGDVPQLRAGVVRDALRELGQSDVVLGTCPDGGYWLVAMRRPHDLFTGIPMGTPEVTRATLDRAARLGLKVRLTSPLRDVDTLADLTAVAATLDASSRTARAAAELGRKKNGGALPLPRRLHIEVTNRCNSLCQTCLRTFAPEPPRDMSVEEVALVVEGLPALESVALHVNGEPLLHPALESILALLRRRDVRMEINTNAIALDAKHAVQLIANGVDRVNVSLDAASGGTYGILRGGQWFERVSENVRRLLRLRRGRRTPRVSFWFTATRCNLHELPAVVRMAGQLSVGEVYLQRLVHFGQGLATSENSLHGRVGHAEEAVVVAAQAEAERLGVKLAAAGGHEPLEMLRVPAEPSPWRGCRRAWASAVVMVNGDVVPCCLATFIAPRERIRMGNVLRDGWGSVWTGEAYRALRASFENESSELCGRCGTEWSL